MGKELEHVIKNCNICIKYRKANVKGTLINRDVPNQAWETLGVDIFFCQNKNWLFTVDYFSKYLELSVIPDITTESVNCALKTQFARFGIPRLVYSVPSSQLNSLNLKKFAKEWNIEWQISSAKYSQSNGMVERHIFENPNRYYPSINPV